MCNGQSDVLGENPEVMLGTNLGFFVQAAQVSTGKPCCKGLGAGGIFSMNARNKQMQVFGF